MKRGTKSGEIDDLVRREAVVHLTEGESSIRGFVMDFYSDPVAIRLAKPVLLVPNERPSELGGEALIFDDKIHFVQLLGAG